MHHIYAESCEKWLEELQLVESASHIQPEADKLACQAQGADIFTEGEITLYDANCNIIKLIKKKLFAFSPFPKLKYYSILFQKNQEYYIIFLKMFRKKRRLGGFLHKKESAKSHSVEVRIFLVQCGRQSFEQQTV